MITFAPSPSWSVLAKLFFCRNVNVDEKKLSKPWCNEGDDVIWFSRTAWALHTIVRWWELSFSCKPVVWVPGYFCNHALWPLRQTGAKIIFYPIQEEMLPHWEACAKLAEQYKPDIFIATHFYGFITPTKEIEDFCRQYEALFVEDAAHILVPTGDVGQRGHFILYSPYKLFPLAHGAICVMKPEVFDYLRRKNKKEKSTIRIVSLQVGRNCPSVSKWFFKKIIQKLGGNRFDFLRKKAPFEGDGVSSPMPYTPQMHAVMKKMLYLMLEQIPRIVEHRKECAMFWDRIFFQNNIEVQCLRFSSEEIPYAGVFKFLHGEAAEIYNMLCKWPLSSWPDLPPEVKAAPISHRTTLYFRNNILFVPVHQTLKLDELLKRCRR